MKTSDDYNQEYRNQLIRYTYYLIALSVTAIGFVIVTTSEISLDISQILLAMGIISWGLSIHTGFKYLEKHMDALFYNINLLKTKEGVHELSGKNLGKIEYVSERFKEEFDKIARSSVPLHRWQYIWFIIGIIFYLTWHIIGMYYRGL